MAERIRAVDTTLRDGQLSLWATNMRTGMMLPIAKILDDAGFDAIELMGSAFFKKCVRDLCEDPWERIRLVSGLIRKTPLRALRGNHISAFQMTPPLISDLWNKRLAANGMRQIRILDPANTVSNIKRQVKVAREAGMDVIVDLVFSVSPKHTDAYYAERARDLATCDGLHLVLKDPGGLLTPERTRTLVRTLLACSGGRPVELHTHCTTGLGPLCCIEAIRAGATIVDTAIPPLANGSSQPSVFNVMDNAAALGYEVDLDQECLHAIERHFRRIAERDALPVGAPVEYDEYQRQHQVPGGMVTNFRSQLGQLGMAHRLREVLDETIRVRSELGYPIMVTPYSQFVGTQAAVNVILGERYKEVSDDLIHYALGHWGQEEADSIVPNIQDRILGRSRAKELASDTLADMTPRDLRRQLGVGSSVDDDELLLRYLTGAKDVQRMRSAGPVKEDIGEDKPLLSFLRSTSAASQFRSIYIEKGNVRVRILRDRISATAPPGREDIDYGSTATSGMFSDSPHKRHQDVPAP